MYTVSFFVGHYGCLVCQQTTASCLRNGAMYKGNPNTPSHRRRGATAVLVQHKPQWHRHDRRVSAVVPSLIAMAVAPRKIVKTAELRGATCGGNFEHVQNFHSPTAGWANPQWDRRGTAMTAVAPYKDRSSTSITAVPPQYNRRALSKK